MKSNGVCARMAVLLLLMSVVITGWSVTAQATAGVPIVPENAAQVEEILRLGRGSIDLLAYSPDGVSLAVGTSIGVWIYDATELNAEADPRFITVPRVQTLAYSPDGGQIVVAGFDQPPALYDVENGEGNLALEVISSEGELPSFADVTFSPDGGWIAGADRDWNFTIWDAATGAQITRIAPTQGRGRAAPSLEFAPDGTRLYVSGAQSIQAWDVSADSEPVLAAEHPEESEPGALAVNPVDGTLAAMVFRAESTRIFSVVLQLDPETLEPVQEIEAPFLLLGRMAYSPDGTRLAISGLAEETEPERRRYAALWLLDTASGETLWTSSEGEFARGQIAFSPDGSRVVAEKDGRIEIFDTASGEVIESFRGAHYGTPFSLAIDSTGARVGAETGEDTAHILDLTTGEQLHVLEGHTDYVRTVEASADGTILATGSNDTTIRLWDFASGELLHTLEGHTVPSDRLAFSPDGSRLASSTASFAGGSPESADYDVRVWDIASGETIHRLQAHERQATALAFSPDGTRLVTTDFDGFAYLWDVATGEQIAALQTETVNDSYTLAIAFTPDSSRVVTSGVPGDVPSVLVWDAETGEAIAALEGHTDFIGNLALSPDGARLISVSLDATARVWDMQTYEALHVLEHDGAVARVTFSPDGKIAATASSDFVIRLWDVATGEPLAALAGHALTIYALTFTPEGTRLITSSGDDTIRVWAVP